MLPGEVCTYLEAQGLGLSFSVSPRSLFGVPFPETAPDVAAYVELLPGQKSDRTFGPSLQAPLGEWAEFLVVVRGGRDSAQATEILAHNVYKKLDGLGPVVLSGVLYRDVRATEGPPRFLDDDHNDRPLYFCMYVADKDRS